MLRLVMRRRRSIGTALDYVKALSRGTRANCWELAEAAGHEGPGRMQALLRSYRWSWEKLRALLPALAAQCLADDPDDLIGPGIAIDETAHLKKGSATACAAPQHAGVTGKVENCVTWVFAALVTARGRRGPISPSTCPRHGPGTCRAARRPGSRRPWSSPRSPSWRSRRSNAWQPQGCGSSGSPRTVYGRCGEFRDACQALSLAYVVIFPCDYRITVARDTVIRADQAIPGAVFERRSCGNETKGPRYGDWALIATADPREFLLIRRADREKNPYTFYLCWAPQDRPATMTYFVTIAGRRWPVEVTFKTARDTLSWDQSQPRTYDGICRHTVLTALAQLRTACIRVAMISAATLPDVPGHAAATSAATADQDTAGTADLQFHSGGAPVPVKGGQAWPPAIPPIELSAAEAARIERLTRDYAAGLLSRARWHHYSTRLQALVA